MGFFDYVLALNPMTSGIADVRGQEQANETNLQAVRETNQQNYKIWQEQKEYQTGERLATQEYNTPSAQRARFEAAGINPYFALGQMDAGNTQAMTSPSAPNMVPGTVNPVRYSDALSPVKDTAMAFMQMQGLGYDNDLKRVQASYANDMALAELLNKRADLKNKGLEADIYQQQYDDYTWLIEQHKQEAEFLRNTRSERELQERVRREGMQLENKGKELANEYQRLQNKYFSKLSDKQLQVMNAQISDYLSSASLNNAKERTESFNATCRELEGAGIRMDNEQKRILFKYTERCARYGVEKAKYDARISHNEAESIQLGPVKWKPNSLWLHEHGYYKGDYGSRR